LLSLHFAVNCFLETGDFKCSCTCEEILLILIPVKLFGAMALYFETKLLKPLQVKEWEVKEDHEAGRRSLEQWFPTFFCSRTPKQKNEQSRTP